LGLQKQFFMERESDENSAQIMGDNGMTGRKFSNREQGNADRYRAGFDDLLSKLASDDGMVRREARQALVDRGDEAVPGLKSALRHTDDRVRWEAAKAFGELSDPEAATDLIFALEDEKSEIRWLAAEALIALDREGILPLLRRLIDHAESEPLREGAHHVLNRQSSGKWRPALAPVVEDLELERPQEAVPVSASKALRWFDRHPAIQF
jgi:HEAT repeat protein